MKQTIYTIVTTNKQSGHELNVGTYHEYKDALKSLRTTRKGFGKSRMVQGTVITSHQREKRKAKDARQMPKLAPYQR